MGKVRSESYCASAGTNSRFPQIQMLNVKPPISRTAFSTSWIFMSRNNRPALIFRFWFYLYSNLLVVQVQKRVNCLRRPPASSARVSESWRTVLRTTMPLISVSSSKIYILVLGTHPLEMSLRRSANAVVIWFKPSTAPAPMGLCKAYIASPSKIL